MTSTGTTTDTGTDVEIDVDRAPVRRTEFELLLDQLAGLDAWHQRRRAGSAADDSVSVTREVRLDLRRRTEARQLEQAALLARSEQHLRESRRQLTAPRAVIALRSDWVRKGVCDALAARGVDVVAALENGAETLGVTVLEQPELLVVDELLPSMSGLELVREVSRIAPHTIVGVHVESAASIARMVEAGARLTFTRRCPHKQIADELLACSVG